MSSMFGSRSSNLREGGEGEYPFVVLGADIQNPPKLPAGAQAYPGSDALRLVMVYMPTEKTATRAGGKPQPQVAWIKLSDKKKSVWEQWVTKLEGSGVPTEVLDAVFADLEKAGNDREKAGEIWRSFLAGRVFRGAKRSFKLGEGIKESDPVMCLEKWEGKLDLAEAVPKFGVDVKATSVKYADPQTNKPFPIKPPSHNYWGSSAGSTSTSSTTTAPAGPAVDPISTLLQAHVEAGGAINMMAGVTSFQKAGIANANAAFFDARKEALAKGLIKEEAGGITRIA